MIVVVAGKMVDQSDDVAFGDIKIADPLPLNFIEYRIEVLLDLFTLLLFRNELQEIFLLSDLEDVGP